MLLETPLFFKGFSLEKDICFPNKRIIFCEKIEPITPALKGGEARLIKAGFNSPTLASKKLQIRFDTPSACGGVVHYAFSTNRP